MVDTSFEVLLVVCSVKVDRNIYRKFIYLHLNQCILQVGNQNQERYNNSSFDNPTYKTIYNVGVITLLGNRTHFSVPKLFARPYPTLS